MILIKKINENFNHGRRQRGGGRPTGGQRQASLPRRWPGGRGIKEEEVLNAASISLMLAR